MMGSAIALAVAAAATYAGAGSMEDSSRPWAASGLGVAAILDAAVASYFIRASTKS
jgi:hypothetical protein